VFLKLAKHTAGLDFIYIKISSEPAEFNQSEPQRYGRKWSNAWNRIPVTR